jgi:hypothetical protein
MKIKCTVLEPDKVILRYRLKYEVKCQGLRTRNSVWLRKFIVYKFTEVINLDI